MFGPRVRWRMVRNAGDDGCRSNRNGTRLRDAVLTVPWNVVEPV